MTITSANKTNIFRENAIQHLNAIHDVQVSLKIISPRLWMWMLMLILATTGILWWGINGKIALKIEAPGIILSESQIEAAENAIKDSIKDRQDKLNRLAYLYHQKKKLYEKRFITLLDLMKTKEEYVAAKENLANRDHAIYIAPQTQNDHAPLSGLLFVNHTLGKKISTGMEVFILPNNLSAFDYGYMIAHVIHVSVYPVSKQLVYSYLQNMNLVDQYFREGAPFMVKIQFKMDKHTSSGLSWTSRSGAPFAIQAGTTVSAKINYQTCSPLQLIYKTRHCR